MDTDQGRGRPQKPVKFKRRNQIAFKATDEEREVIVEAANQAGLDVATYVRLKVMS